ncbi:MAG: ROK family protein [Alkaliphilus sp.]
MYFIGVDLGGTAIKIGLITEEGRVICKLEKSTPVSEGFEAVISTIDVMIYDIIEKGKIKRSDIIAIGAGVPGACSEDGLMYSAVNLGWKNVEFAKKLKELSNIDVYIENDATVAALGEVEFGAAKGMKNVVMLTLGTGVGGGIVINNQIFSGSNGMGSELGHMIIGENYFDCNCGNNGCLETFASATAIIKHTQKLLGEDKRSSLIRDKVKGNYEKIDAKLVFECAKLGDELALESFKRFIKYLSIGIGNIFNIFEPDVVLLGGGVSKAGDYIIEPVIKETYKHITFDYDISDRIAVAKLENNAGMLGSAMYARMRAV